MLNVNKIKEFAEKTLSGSDIFVVDVKCSAGNAVEIIIDGDRPVSIEDCTALTLAVEEEFDREIEDYELTVSSAGIGRPLKLLRQYRKLIGKPVEVILKNGTKIVAELRDASPDSIELAYTEKVIAEGKKRKTETTVVKEYKLDEIKTAAEYLDYK